MQQIRETPGTTWYTRREGVVRGPFEPAHITRYILLGRIRLDDELSHDRETWQQARSVVMLLPEELMNLQGWEDYQQLVEARMRVDERRQDRRCSQCPNCASCHPERRSGTDRRKDDNGPLVDQFLYGAKNSSPKVPPARLRSLLLTLLFAALLFVWLLPVTR